MFIFRSLRFKIGLLAVLLVLLVTAGIGIISSNLMTKAIEDEITKRGESLARNLAASVVDPLSSGDDLYIATFVTEAVDTKRNPDVLYVVVADVDGTIMGYKADPTIASEEETTDLFGQKYSTPKGIKGLGEQEFLAQDYVHEKAGPAYDIGISVLLAGEKPVGQVHVGISQSGLIAAKKQTIITTIIISAIGLLVGIIGSLLISGLITRPVNRLLKGVKTMGTGDYSVNVPAKSKDEIGTLTVAFNEMAASIGEKELIKDAFSRYVSHQVADIIFHDPDKYISTLRGQRKDVTILFADIRGFTSISERSAPEQVVALLNDYLSYMTEIIFEYNGTLDKFLGDGLMAVFGAPVDMESSTLPAVRAALDMRTQLAKFNEERRTGRMEEIRVGIGINYGDAIVGNVGSQDRMDYTVIGDTVNTAARIQGYSQEGQIILSKPAYDKVANFIEVKPMGGIDLKGKAEPVEMYEVIRIRENAV